MVQGIYKQHLDGYDYKVVIVQTPAALNER